eukprot:TRINITY_DN3913_c0_g5_i2.p1 TRINITY_DN3913_c0_g5~~TRINITY_DN3913_c0_g5_i2.p1  ORF type:complete len:268 (-),score=55.70 TRINITY_DN3913_c0_g5_i2:3-806(-)
MTRTVRRLLSPSTRNRTPESRFLIEDSEVIVFDWSKEKERIFFETLASHLGFKEREEWYSITKHQVKKHGGEGILKMFNGSVKTALEKIYDDHDWLPWKFEHAPAGTWDTISSQRDFMFYLAKELKITKMEDWYNVSVVQIREKGGNRLLNKYDGSPVKMITSLLKEHKWNVLQFAHKPAGVWDDVQAQREMLNHLAKELQINRMKGWYSVSAAQIREKGGGGLLLKYNNSPAKMITSVITEHEWDLKKFHPSLKTRMRSDIDTRKT